jgi:hypothetical protein
MVMNEPVITAVQLFEQLSKYEGETISNPAGLAIVIMNGAAADSKRDQEDRP